MKLIDFFNRWLQRPKEVIGEIGPPHHVPDYADDFSRLHRQLRRQALLIEQQSEQIKGLGTRLESMDQQFLKLRSLGDREQDASVSVIISESDWLNVLDRLDRALLAEDLGDSARTLVQESIDSLRELSGLRPIARLGAVPDTMSCRIVEVIKEPEASGFRVTKVIRQGYLRDDGSQIREAVVIVSGSSDLTFQ